MVPEKDAADYYLYEYSSYEEYKEVQTFHNKRKISHVWADKKTLSLIKTELEKDIKGKVIKGICHGSRNGFEQAFFNEDKKYKVIGTDISDTANQFENTVQWDFHDENKEWINKFDFVYSNSLDQGWNPKTALQNWLNQLNKKGMLVIEHTEVHGPKLASKMDPFGVRPEVMPYVLAEWFGHDISIRFVRSVKENNNLDVWLFFVKKNSD